MNYTQVQFTAFLSHLSQNTKKAKTNKQTKPQACIRSLVPQLTELLAPWMPACICCSSLAFPDRSQKKSDCTEAPG